MTYTGVLETPFDFQVPDYTPETPQWDLIIREAMRLHTLEMRCAMPGFVLAVQGTGLVDVQPTLQQRFRSDSASMDLPAIKNVPVCLPSGAQYSMKVPIATGDSGLLVFGDRSLEAWAESNGSKTVDPANTRQHNLSDAIFLPGCWPKSQQVADTTTDMVMKAGQVQVRLLQNGKLVLGSTADGGQELLDLLDQLMSNQNAILDALCNSTLTLTLMGPQPFIASSIAAFKQLQSQLQAIQKNLETLKK